MLFNSYEFLFVFLPATLGVFLLLRHWGLKGPAIAVLVFCSLLFYSYWNPKFVVLLIASVIFNYVLGVVLRPGYSGLAGRFKRLTLLFGVAANLATLGWFKYSVFLITNVNLVLPAAIPVPDVILPLAISFFTFQQIAYLVDSHNGEVDEKNFLHYALFVTFFPQLVIGPIVHHAEMMPQFDRLFRNRRVLRNLAIGVTIFSIGLFKKAVLADNIAVYSSPVFDAAAGQENIGMVPAWGAAFAFATQLYFDFSGYSDMAIGLGRMFGIKLPLNFNSPYKARSIIEFWRHWHMTLTRFVQAYVFMPLAVSAARKSAARNLTGWAEFTQATALPLMVAFVLVGVWHGAGWNFFIFGLLHGGYMVTNYIWRRLDRKQRLSGRFPVPLWAAFCWALTFVAVVVSLILFRAENFAAARAMFAGMIGLSSGADHLFAGPIQVAATIGLIALAVVMPNTQQIMARYRPAVDAAAWIHLAGPRRAWQWSPTIPWSAGIMVLFGVGVLHLSGTTEFLYFRF